MSFGHMDKVRLKGDKCLDQNYAGNRWDEDLILI